MNRLASQTPEFDWDHSSLNQQAEEARRARVSHPESIDTAFQAFHAAHPIVYTTLENYAKEWFDFHNKLGIKMLWERCRWQLAIGSTSVFKMNNNFTSRYARLLIERHPEWKDKIETRQLRSL